MTNAPLPLQSPPMPSPRRERKTTPVETNGLDIMPVSRIRAGRLHDPRSSRLPWVKATGTPATLSRKAAQYLRVFDYKKAAQYDLDTEILANVVCNLRNYYDQDADQTVRLVLDLFNPKSSELWSPEGIRLAWDLVEPFTPTLALADEKTIAKRKVATIENEVIDLIAWTKPGGRVSAGDLLETFREWNPWLQVTPNAFTRAVQAVTGMTKLRSNGKDYWVGFHLPAEVNSEQSAAEAA